MIMTNNHIVPQILQSYECFRALEYDPLCYRNGTVIVSKTVTIYTGTFTKANGDSRTMNFIRSEDLPSEMQSDRKTSSDRRSTEVVFDIDKKQFRNFNLKTVHGSVSSRQGSYSFND